MHISKVLDILKKIAINFVTVIFNPDGFISCQSNRTWRQKENRNQFSFVSLEQTSTCPVTLTANKCIKMNFPTTKYFENLPQTSVIYIYI